MTTVTGFTADRMLAIESASVISGTVDGNGNLILTTKGGQQINAGPVTGPQGPPGPVGSDLAVISARPVLDIGIANQIRAGRQLSPADFANIGLSAPLGLWNLSDLTDSSGNGRNLINKGAVGFAPGINGSANTSAQFTGSTAQVLYISDTGAADPFRIKTGSFGCWFKTAKKGTQQALISKLGGANNYTYEIYIEPTTNAVCVQTSVNGASTFSAQSQLDRCDNRWHFVVAVHNSSTLQLFVDGMHEGSVNTVGPIFVAPVVFNIGGRLGDASTATATPCYGQIDEVFITGDVLTEDQVRNLYASRLSHTLAAIPSRIGMNVRRRRRGAVLVPSDFPAQPLRLHNFSAGSVADEGSNNLPLTNNGAVSVAGPDGTAGNAMNFQGSQSLAAADTGLPAGTAARSFGFWTNTVQNSGPTGVALLWANSHYLGISAGVPIAYTTYGGGESIQGGYIADGRWHFVVEVDDNAAIDGVKRKLYVDGKCVAGSVNIGTLVLTGANGFLVGCYTGNANYYLGQLDAVFVCNYALTPEQILSLYNKGTQTLAVSPKNSGDHVEAMSSTDLLAIFDTLDACHQVDLKVAA